MARKKETYSNLLEKLESTISSLESNELDLEDSIKNYEDGVALVNKLYKLLNDYQGKITIINDNKKEVEFED